MKKILPLLLFLLITALAPAQIQLVYYEVQVMNEGETLRNPWAGGFNSPQFSQIDFNNDGLQDLVVFERDFYGSVKTFINTGIPGEINYKYTPKWQSVFPAMRNWMLLRDYNCDGYKDIFTSIPGGVAVYLNQQANSSLPEFTLQTPLLFTEGPEGSEPLYVAPPDIPAIADVDSDGDLDILSFNIIGSRVQYHKNLSMENYGNCETLEFAVANPCWGYFSEDGNNNTVTLFDTCDFKRSATGKEKHAGSTVLALDLNGNGAKDLLLGDISYNNLVMLENGGDQDEAIMISQETNFPANSTPVDLNVFPAAFHLDVNNDGLKDLLVAPNNPNTSENHHNIWYYRNEGTQAIPEFTFSEKNFLMKDMIDLGERSYPAFMDENADGLIDIVAGSFGYFEEAGSYSSRLMLLRNTGTPEEPEFEVITNDYAGLDAYGFEGVYPSFGDMDNDGDPDMIVGDEEGRLHLFTNEAGAGNPADFILTDPNYYGIDVGESARPQIYDVNNDGLPDLISGERSGKIRYFENTGTPMNPVFSQLATNDSLGNIDVMPECCSGFSAPFMTKDSLGNTVLYVGSEQGYLYLYNDIDNNLNGDFILVDSLYLHGTEINVTGADINNEDGMEFVGGLSAGGIQLFKRGKPFIYGMDERKTPGIRVNLFPNPVKDLINVEISGTPSYDIRAVSILNIYGQRIYSNFEPGGKTALQINISKLPPGAYVLQIESDHGVLPGKKFLKID